MISQSAILDRLNGILDPCSVASGQPMGLVDMGLIESATVGANGVATIDLRLTSPCCMMIGFFVVEIKKAITGVDGVSDVVVTHDVGERWEPDMIAGEFQKRRRERFKALEKTIRSANAS